MIRFASCLAAWLTTATESEHAQAYCCLLLKEVVAEFLQHLQSTVFGSWLARSAAKGVLARTGTAMTPYEEAPAKEDAGAIGAAAGALRPLGLRQIGWAARARLAPAGDGRDDGDAGTAQLRHVFGGRELECGWSTLQ